MYKVTDSTMVNIDSKKTLQNKIFFLSSRRIAYYVILLNQIKKELQIERKKSEKKRINEIQALVCLVQLQSIVACCVPALKQIEQERQLGWTWTPCHSSNHIGPIIPICRPLPDIVRIRSGCPNQIHRQVT
jgi:hypothetical protein